MIYTYIQFSGDRFWLYNSNYMVSNFPEEGRRISELGIDKSVKKIDAVFVWAYNKRTYLVSRIYMYYNKTKF